MKLFDFFYRRSESLSYFINCFIKIQINDLVATPKTTGDILEKYPVSTQKVPGMYSASRYQVSGLYSVKVTQYVPEKVLGAYSVKTICLPVSKRKVSAVLGTYWVCTR